MCLQGLSGQNHVGIPVRAHRGCALTCALKNRAYGASVPAGGVCLQGQFYGTRVRYGTVQYGKYYMYINILYRTPV